MESDFNSRAPTPGYDPLRHIIVHEPDGSRSLKLINLPPEERFLPETQEKPPLSRRALMKLGALTFGVAGVAAAGAIKAHEKLGLGAEMEPDSIFYTVTDDESVNTVFEIVQSLFGEQLGTDEAIMEYIYRGTIINRTAADNPDRETSYDMIWPGDILEFPQP